MANQTSGNVLVAARRETSINVQATATGATQVRFIDGSPGANFKRAPIRSAERRSDLTKTMPRTGYESVDGSYTSELTSGGHVDLFLESLMRGVWATATSFSFASVTTVAIATGTLTPGSSSSFITAGVRVGDIFYLSSTTVSGNNGINVPVLSIAAASGGAITVPAGTFTTLAASATGTLTILKKLVSPATRTDYSYTFEQYDTDIDLSKLYTGNRIVGGKFSMRPGQPPTIEYRFMGCDRPTALVSGTSPYFTSPSLTTGLAMICEDSVMRFNGAAATTFTSFDLDFSINANGQPVLGSTSTADIFLNEWTLTGTIAGLRSDLSKDTLFDAETEVDLMMKFEEPNTGPPKTCFNLFIPRLKIIAIDDPVGGGDGAKIESIQFECAMKAVSASTGVEATLIKFSSSAP